MYHFNLLRTRLQREEGLARLSRKPILRAIDTFYELGLLPFGLEVLDGMTKRQMVDHVNRFISHRRA